MPDDHSEYRVTIRLTPALYAQLEARGSHGQPLAAIVRNALEAYLVWQPEQPVSPESLANTLAAMTADIHDVRQQVQALTTRVEEMAASRQPVAATPAAVPETRQPSAAMAASVPATAAPPKPPPRQRPPVAPALETLPAHIRRIADAREHYERLSLRDFAQLLYERNIYRATDRTGAEVPVNAGTLKKWLDKAGL